MQKQEREKLTQEELEEELESISEWKVVDGKLHREFQFENFIEAFAFMTKLAIVAERINHHPDWTNVYNKVTVDLITHDVNGISILDCDLARAADRYYGK